MADKDEDKLKALQEKTKAQEHKARLQSAKADRVAADRRIARAKAGIMGRILYRLGLKR